MLPSDQSATELVRLETVRQLCDLLLAMTKEGLAALPRFLNNDRLKDIVEKGLKNPKKLHDLLRKEVDRVCPVIPTLPPLRIIGGK